jgi:hypothetical protein
LKKDWVKCFCVVITNDKSVHTDMSIPQKHKPRICPTIPSICTVITLIFHKKMWANYGQRTESSLL